MGPWPGRKEPISYIMYEFILDNYKGLIQYILYQHVLGQYPSKTMYFFRKIKVMIRSYNGRTEG